MADVMGIKGEIKENPFLRAAWSDVARQTWGPVKPGSAEDHFRYERHDLEKQLKEAAPIVEHYRNDGLQQEKTHLLASLDHAFGKEARGVFSDELRQFEVRAWANGISKSQIAETYKEISRVFKHTGGPLTDDLRKQVAKDIIRNCADPTNISQGDHNTCNVTAVEVRTYALYPAMAARLVADVATTGEYRASNGTVVKLDPASLQPDSEARQDRPALGLRAYATQLFNMCAVNLWYAANRPGTRYEQRQQVVGGKQSVVEQLVDYSGSKPVKLKDPIDHEVIVSPHLGASQIQWISDSIVGHHEPFAVLKSGPSFCWLKGQKDPGVRPTDIIDEHEMSVVLGGLKEKHLLPAIAVVDTDVEPLNKDTGSGAYGPGGGHVVNLFDYTRGEHPQVAMDNQWDKKSDHLSGDSRIDLHDMYLCIAGPAEAYADAVSKIAEAAKAGKQAPAEELRVAMSDDKPEHSDLVKAACIVAADSAMEISLAGKDRQKWLESLQSVVSKVHPADKVWLLKQVAQDKVCSEQEFGRLIAGAVRSVSYQKCLAIKDNDAARKRICIIACTELAEYLITLPVATRRSYFSALKEI